LIFARSFAKQARYVTLAKRMKGETDMARRQISTSDLKCPICGKAGTAKWQENANPREQRGDLKRILISVSRGFSINLDSPDDPRIFCTQCNFLIGTWSYRWAVRPPALGPERLWKRERLAFLRWFFVDEWKQRA